MKKLFRKKKIINNITIPKAINNIYCYIRKSTDKQSYDRQIHILKERGYIDGINCTYIEESYTGKKTKRPIFEKLLKNLNENDTIIVESLTRLSRGGIGKTFELINELIYDKKINVIILKENFNLRAGKDLDANTKLLLGIFSVVAEFERDLISERTKERLEALKAQGVKLGRPPKKETLLRYIDLLDYINNNECNLKTALQINNFNKSYYYELTDKFKILFNTDNLEKIQTKLLQEVE